MCALGKHEVPRYSGVDAADMLCLMEQRLGDQKCERSNYYSFNAQPATVSGQRKTPFPFLKFYLSGHSEIQDERGAVISKTEAGELAVFAPGSYANVQFTGPTSFFRVTLLPQESFLAFNDISAVSPGDREPRVEQVTAHVLKGSPSRLIRELFVRLERWPTPADRASLWQLMVREWGACLKEAAAKTRDSAGQRLQQRRSEVMDYLESNAHRLINRESVAGSLGISVGELSRLFQRTGDESFTETLNRVRVEHAKSWLSTCAVSVADVAARCGFSSANYFAQVFRRFEGISPQKWVQGMR